MYPLSNGGKLHMHIDKNSPDRDAEILISIHMNTDTHRHTHKYSSLTHTFITHKLALSNPSVFGPAAIRVWTSSLSPLTMITSLLHRDEQNSPCCVRSGLFLFSIHNHITQTTHKFQLPMALPWRSNTVTRVTH